MTVRNSPVARRVSANGPRASLRTLGVTTAATPGLPSAFMTTTVQFPLVTFQSRARVPAPTACAVQDARARPEDRETMRSVRRRERPAVGRFAGANGDLVVGDAGQVDVDLVGAGGARTKTVAPGLPETTSRRSVARRSRSHSGVLESTTTAIAGVTTAGVDDCRGLGAMAT